MRNGGAIYFDLSNIYIVHNTFLNNRALHGGALYITQIRENSRID